MKEKIYIGIDPGKNGGICCINSDNKIVMKTVIPVIGTDFDKKGMLQLFMDLNSKYNISMCTMEKVQAMPVTAKTACLNIGYGFGLLEMALLCNRIPYQIVSPREWQKVIFKGIKSKDTKIASLTFCERMFPNEDFRKSERCKNFHDGLTDASCIAMHGKRINND